MHQEKDQKNYPFKYVRLMIPLELHEQIVRYQAMKILYGNRKEPLSTCMIELLEKAIDELQVDLWREEKDITHPHQNLNLE